MDARMFGLETPLMAALQHLLDVPDGEAVDKASAAGSGPMRTYVRDSRAMAATPADVKELPGAYSFVVDMPGLGTSNIKVQVEDERVLVISGERRREEREAGSECGFWAVECGGGGGAPPSTLAEFTLNGAGGNDFYDVCSSWRAWGGSDCSPAASIVVGVRQAGGGVVGHHGCDGWLSLVTETIKND